MTTRGILTTIMALAVVLVAAAQQEGTFPFLVERALSQSPTTDFGALREAFTEAAEYDPLFTLTDDYRELRQAIRSGPSESAIAACADLPLAFFVSIDLHRDCAKRLAGLGEREKAGLHVFLADGLLAALTPTTEGLLVVVHVEEEYDYVEAQGLEVLGHATYKPEHKGGPAIEGLQVRNRDGKTSWVRFIKHRNYQQWQRRLIQETMDDSHQQAS